jgi:hypothetical protein
MTMLADYRRLAEFFTAFEWWTCQPRNDLVEQQLPCLAAEGVRYIVYLPTGGWTTIKLPEGKYRARWFNPRSGEYTVAGVATAPSWTSPGTLDGEDWVLLLERDDAAIDRTPPRLIAATATGAERVVATFSKSLDPVSACDSANYAMDGNVRVLAAELADEAGRTVRLRTTPLAEDVRYTLAVHHIRDRAEEPNVMPSVQRATFIRRNPERPLVVLDFSEGQGRTAANVGATADTHPVATLTPDWPRWSTDLPVAGDGVSLDFGLKPGEYAVDLGSDAPELLRGLKSFTITGWLNCRSLDVGPGGNRIVHMADTMGSRAGLDLVVEKQGELVLGVNAYPDVSPARSRPNAISVDPKTGKDNWRFFAVTYDATAASDQVKFYFGSAGRVSGIGQERNLRAGPAGPAHRAADGRRVQSGHSHWQRRPLVSRPGGRHPHLRQQHRRRGGVELGNGTRHSTGSEKTMTRCSHSGGVSLCLVVFSSRCVQPAAGRRTPRASAAGTTTPVMAMIRMMSGRTGDDGGAVMRASARDENPAGPCRSGSGGRSRCRSKED